jgi:hypothetical protein
VTQKAHQCFVFEKTSVKGFERQEREVIFLLWLEAASRNNRKLFNQKEPFFQRKI